MDVIKSGHYVVGWGDLLSEDGQLVSLGDLIRLVSQHECLPLLPAANHTLGILREEHAINFYLTRQAHWAKRVPEDFVWDLERPDCIGRTGLVDSLASHFEQRLKVEDSLYPVIFGGGVAVLLDDLAEAFPFLFEDQSEADFSQATGNLWPLSADSKPTSAHFDDAFRMRHKNKMKEVKIAERANRTRTAITQWIGPVTNGLKLRQFGVYGWIPSPELLAECGLPALQNALPS